MAIVLGSTSPKTTISAVMIDGRHDDAALAVEAQHDAGRDRRGPDGDELAAEQHGADQPAAHADQPSDQRRTRISGHFEGVHAGPRGRSQRRLRAGKEGRKGDTDDNDGDVERYRHGEVLTQTPARREIGRRAAHRLSEAKLQILFQEAANAGLVDVAAR